jgi:SAM-dependent methyltransferase
MTNFLRPKQPTEVAISKREACRLCGSSKLELVLPLGPTPLADAYVAQEHLDLPQMSYPLDLYLCMACGFAQLLDIVHGESVYIDYIYETKSSLGLAQHFDSYSDQTIRKLDLPGGSLVVDIGSNDGTLLEGYKKRGMKVLGVDPAREIARLATEGGIPTLPEFFTSELVKRIRREYGPASLITANNIVANVDDLDSLVSAIRDLLSDDGVFVFESFYLADLLKNMVFDFIYHEHLSAFAVTPLIRFFEKHGMQLFDAERIPTKGGSLRYYVQIKGARRAVSDSIDDLQKLEDEAGIIRPETFAAFFKRIQDAKENVRSLLLADKSRGKKIAGYGASATTTTFIYHFGLTDLLSFIADDYPVKHNLYSPGVHIPVLPSEALYTEEPDTVLIIAWRYFDPIIRKHKRYMDEGGRFIVPLPEVKIF